MSGLDTASPVKNEISTFEGQSTTKKPLLDSNGPKGPLGKQIFSDEEIDDGYNKLIKQGSASGNLAQEGQQKKSPAKKKQPEVVEESKGSAQKGQKAVGFGTTYEKKVEEKKRKSPEKAPVAEVQRQNTSES